MVGIRESLLRLFEIDISEWAFEGLAAVCSLTVFFTAYLMLYKKDKGDL